jgi:hypothetical protein
MPKPKIKVRHDSEGWWWELVDEDGRILAESWEGNLASADEATRLAQEAKTRMANAQIEVESLT